MYGIEGGKKELCMIKIEGIVNLMISKTCMHSLYKHICMYVCNMCACVYVHAYIS